jgi:hypothetical protein
MTVITEINDLGITFPLFRSFVKTTELAGRSFLRFKGLKLNI